MANPNPNPNPNPKTNPKTNPNADPNPNPNPNATLTLTLTLALTHCEGTNAPSGVAAAPPWHLHAASTRERVNDGTHTKGVCHAKLSPNPFHVPNPNPNP